MYSLPGAIVAEVEAELPSMLSSAARGREEEAGVLVSLNSEAPRYCSCVGYRSEDHQLAMVSC